MKILGIESTGLAASVAISDNNKLLAEFFINNKKTHSETLMPMIKDMLDLVDINIQDIDYVACSNGPGSFTGLRIGVATAKGISHGLGKRVIPVPTLDALAYNISKSNGLIVPIMDAKRNQAYTAFYSRDKKFNRLSEYDALDIYEIIANARSYNKTVIFLGDGVAVYKDIIVESGLDCDFADMHFMLQRGSSVCALGYELAKQNKFISADELNPFYLRISQAERELNK